jgi:hypothetical protein
MPHRWIVSLVTVQPTIAHGEWDLVTTERFDRVPAATDTFEWIDPRTRGAEYCIRIERRRQGSLVGSVCSIISTSHPIVGTRDSQDSDHHLELSIRSMRSTALNCSHQLDCRSRTTFL